MALRVADRWFDISKVADGITYIREPYVNDFGRCNIWHVRGRDRDLLIDSGMGVMSLRDAIGHLIEKPLLALASHSHFDHVGSFHEFDQRLVHEAEAGIMRAPSGENTLAAKYVDESFFIAAPYAGFDPAGYAIRPAPATRTLREGDVIDLGDRAFEVLHLPGHSPGSIGLWEAASGILFSGDAVYDGELLDDCYHSDIADYIETMERLRALPVRIVHGGHCPSFGRQRMLAIIDEYLAGRRAPGCPGERSGD